MWWIIVWMLWWNAGHTRDLCPQVIIIKAISLYLQKNCVGPRFHFIWVFFSLPGLLWCIISLSNSKGCLSLLLWPVWYQPNKNNACWRYSQFHFNVTILHNNVTILKFLRFGLTKKLPSCKIEMILSRNLWKPRSDFFLFHNRNDGQNAIGI